ncbi:hypothetical protein D9613_000057 [Agrocybe pediades]|uniref:F-box domain-containing protein n=1 Tax=Agrocybe pediades TaxID=84607 RepID=A0A8H4R1G6_9AGAR|nr:hypothetical protein D9613_000057 [Agrocybe pediades]
MADYDKPNLTTIPSEIVIEILQHVDVLTILQIRQTCRHLYELSTARLIWVNLLQECEHLFPGNVTLEKPLDMYSSEELERVVLVVESAELGWRTSDGCPSRQRSIAVDARLGHSSDYYKHAYLVPGGRWLLVFQAEGEISYYDLDSTLTNWMAKSIGQYEFGTLYLCLKDRTLLVCAPLVSRQFLSTRKPWIGASLSLRNQHLAFSISPPDEGWFVPFVQYICVVEWPLVEDGSLDYPRRIIKTELRAGEVHILPNNRVSVYLPPSLHVYNYSALAYTDHLPEARLGHFRLTPSSECSFISCSLNTTISVPFEVQGSVQFIIVTENSAQSASIPDGFCTPRSLSPGELSTEMLMPLPRHDYCEPWTARYSFGQHRGILYNFNSDDNCIDFLLFDYDAEQKYEPGYVPVVKSVPVRKSFVGSPRQGISNRTGIPPPPQRRTSKLLFRNLLLDEGSGRVVVPFKERFGILDFALVHKNSRTP